MRSPLRTHDEYLQRYPRVCAHIIAESLSGLSPIEAAATLKAAQTGDRVDNEWVRWNYRGDARAAVQQAIRGRVYHRRTVSSYQKALNSTYRYWAAGSGP